MSSREEKIKAIQDALKAAALDGEFIILASIITNETTTSLFITGEVAASPVEIKQGLDHLIESTMQHLEEEFPGFTLYAMAEALRGFKKDVEQAVGEKGKATPLTKTAWIKPGNGNTTH